MDDNQTCCVKHLKKLLTLNFQIDGITSKMMSDKVNDGGYEVEWGLQNIFILTIQE